MSALLLLCACLLLGALVKRFAKPPEGMVLSVNWWVMRIALPALVLARVPEIKLDAHLWFPVAAMWLTFFGAWLLFALLGRALHWPKRRVGALVLLAGLGNTSFMGYPIMQALHGSPGLALAVVADQVGSFPLLAAAGVLVASLSSGSEVRPALIARNLLAFPSFIALFVALAAGALGGWPKPVVDTLNVIGDTMTPLSLFSVGMQFRLQMQASQVAPLSVALGWKLLLAPLLTWALGLAAGIGGLTLTVSVLQAGMAPMISAAILADQYQLDPPLANTVLGAGIVLSMVSVPLWNLVC